MRRGTRRDRLIVMTVVAQSSGFDAHLDWGPSDFDRTHVFSATALYDLPFGQNGGALSRLTGGWYVAGIFSASSGVPLDVCQRTGVFGGASCSPAASARFRLEARTPRRL